MAPRYPRPTRPDPPQAGRFTLKPLPTFIGVEDIPSMEEHPPTLNMDDELFMAQIGIRR